MKFFADTYALYAIVAGEQNYRKYSQNFRLITTRLNLMELYYQLLREGLEGEAEKYYGRFQEAVALFSDETIKEAMKFKLKNKSRNLSYVDCIGYTVSLKLKARFLTGDKEFEKMPNVEFVK